MFTNESTRVLAQGVLDYINEHPEQHDQGVFFASGYTCGTTMCVGGTAIFLAYGISDKASFYDKYPYSSYSDVAGPLLGFENIEESDILFYEMNENAAVEKLKFLIVGDVDGFLSSQDDE